MSRETILIVEDNPVLREGLQDMLELEGFSVFTASNGQQALDEMSDRSPNLILSDIAMPVMAAGITNLTVKVMSVREQSLSIRICLLWQR